MNEVRDLKNEAAEILKELEDAEDSLSDDDDTDIRNGGDAYGSMLTSKKNMSKVIPIEEEERDPIEL